MMVQASTKIQTDAEIRQERELQKAAEEEKMRESKMRRVCCLVDARCLLMGTIEKAKRAKTLAHTRVFDSKEWNLRKHNAKQHCRKVNCN